MVLLDEHAGSVATLPSDFLDLLDALSGVHIVLVGDVLDDPVAIIVAIVGPGFIRFASSLEGPESVSSHLLLGSGLSASSLLLKELLLSSEALTLSLLPFKSDLPLLLSHVLGELDFLEHLGLFVLDGLK